jgi:hypothetical protein
MAFKESNNNNNIEGIIHGKENILSRKRKREEDANDIVARGPYQRKRAGG